jgi:hypothetical protein
MEEASFYFLPGEGGQFLLSTWRKESAPIPYLEKRVISCSPPDGRSQCLFLYRERD